MTLKRLILVIAIATTYFATSEIGYAALLIGYWPFEEEGETVFDHSGQGNDGELTGATRSEGKVGRGLSFDGSGGVTIPHSPSLDSLPGGFTLSAWIKPTLYPDFTTIFWKTDRHNKIHQLHFQVNGRLHAAMNQEAGSGGFGAIAPSSTVGLNEWHYAAWTYDETTQRLWDNGVEVFSTPFTDPWVGNDITLLIGDHPEIDTARFHGMIDEARIYRGALTQDELLRDMSADPSPVIPEPSSFLLLGSGLLGLVGWRRRS